MASITCSKQFNIGVVTGSLISMFLFYNLTSINTQYLPINDWMRETPESQPSENVTEPGSNSKIFCWVMTSPANKFKAQVVKETWGRKCDRLIFVSSKDDKSLPAIGFPIGGESRSKLWTKSNYTLHYVYSNYLNDYDWFFKADDDTYTIMENLRHYLSTQDKNQALFIGCRLTSTGNESRFDMSGGPGYILSRESLRRLVEDGLMKDGCKSTYRGDQDDMIISRCLAKVNVTFIGPKDRHGRQRFMNYLPEDLLNHRTWQHKIIKRIGYDHHSKNAELCCSDEAISFHYISGYRAKVFEYLLYHLNIFQR